MTDATDKRWKVSITYRYDDGPRKTVFFIEEMTELAAIIEHGPDWNAMVDCRITYNGRNYPKGWTVEQIADAA
ncbi:MULTISPECIES: hypothetical protein [Rhizobium]|uniref:hypothetical protein n=1 Tax=Rhizobium TaxID=379 RepID=UPI0010315E9F|nr:MULTISPECIES: hypothetical protein [Rhizobium]TBD37726.1 hypothetical protein ELH18_09845 [Rhizobium ruizarguesonis]TBD42434.1 hypothetical protein ELH19_09545 [Rhizobium ruizarguesonis]TBD58781.1 hypothetical protein ELH15_09605 [Rhizobium ruizarguesonis]TBD85067.1 hypothetical protein ELH13_09730 [Rhizobium ruizarguesonis]TBD89931.1 hypothetical protein ELH14_09970 [Rhizobium ruizarguesonis]